MGSGASSRDVRAGSGASAEKVTAPTKRWASSVSTGTTCAPASTRRRHSSAALYAAMPPVTPRTTRRPRKDGRSERSGDVGVAMRYRPAGLLRLGRFLGVGALGAGLGLGFVGRLRDGVDL